jgi:hypothetical protein
MHASPLPFRQIGEIGAGIREVQAPVFSSIPAAQPGRAAALRAGGGHGHSNEF